MRVLWLTFCFRYWLELEEERVLSLSYLEHVVGWLTPVGRGLSDWAEEVAGLSFDWPETNWAPRRRPPIRLGCDHRRRTGAAHRRRPSGCWTNRLRRRRPMKPNWRPSWTVLARVARGFPVPAASCGIPESTRSGPTAARGVTDPAVANRTVKRKRKKIVSLMS